MIYVTGLVEKGPNVRKLVYFCLLVGFDLEVKLLIVVWVIVLGAGRVGMGTMHSSLG